MNSQLYKVIYSKTAGRFVVVSDIATNNVKSNANINSNIRARSLVLNLKEIVVSLLLIGSLSETVYAKSQIFADRNAPKNNQAQVLKTANGIAQINITTPTKRGVSMNQYRQFDIDTEGAVLNNSRKATETKLGGWISGNQNLNKSEAKVIVNQVNSNNPSQLKGYIEVGGKKAEVIVANPSGISVDGGGFINASKAQIISGSVQFNNDEVKGFNVHKHNKITIQKNGLDVSDTEYTQIISAANEINGKIYGKSIKVSAVTGNVDKDGNSESTQNVSVDVSHLGGMYAGKITMVGNKNGFAVNNAGQLIANSQINIDADGNINNKPTGTIAAKEIKLKAKNFNNQGRTEGSDSIRTDLSGDLNNSGSLSSNGSILINAITGWLNNSGTINSNKLIANTANFNNTGILNIASLLDMVFKGGLNNAGTISNSGATTLRTNGGDITNSGTIKSSQLTAYTDNLNNSGLIAATNLIATYLSGSLNNSGLINSNGTTNINASHGDINNSGEINGNQINLTTQKLNNAENGTINALTYLNANLSEQLNNRGTINSNGTFQINGTAAELNNTGNINSNNLIANIYNLNNYKQLNIKSNLLTNLSGRLYNEGEINSNGIAEIRSTNDIDNIGSIISQELKTNSNNINNHGRISVIAAMESNIAGSLNNRGLISNNGISYINTDNLSNTGTINGNQIDITTNQINNSGSIEADSALLAKVSGSVNNSGLLNSNGITYINADGTISNTGRIYGNHIALGAMKLINGNGKNNNPNSSSGSGGVIAARNRLDIGASEIYNNGVNAEIILSNGSFAIGGRLDENGYAVGLANTLVNDGGLIALNGSGVFGVSNLINKNIDDSLVVEEKLIDSRQIDSYTFVGDEHEYIVGEDGDIETHRKTITFHLNDHGKEKHETDESTIHKSHYDTTGTLHSNYQRDIYMEEVVDNKPGRIYIGGSLTANGSNWLNKDSEILIGGSLSGSLSDITIDETPMNGRIEKKGEYSRAQYKNPKTSKGKYKWHYGGEINSSEEISEEALQYIVKEGADTNLPNQTISSATTHNNGLTDIELNAKTQPVVLPASTSALSNININRYNIENPNLPPIETDAKYTEYKKWLSKAYMIERLDPNNLHKRIGDNVSISLSGRLNNLNNRKYTGSIIFANDINLSNLNTLNNSGTIQTRQTMNLDGKQIDNSGRLKGDVVIANADKIDITGGKVIADSAIVMEGKEINLESTTTNNKDGTSSIDKRATIKLTGKNNNGIIYIDGEDKLNSKAAKISNTSQGGNTTISGGEIELGTVTTSHNEKFGEATDKNHRIVKTTEEIGTNINTAGNINVIAHSGRLNGTAVNINSKDGTALLYGKNGIAINEGRQTIKLDEAYQSKSKNLLSKKTNNYQIQRDDNLAINSNITGNKVIIQSQKDIDLTGTNAVSDNGTILYSESGNINLNAAINHIGLDERLQTKKSGLKASFNHGLLNIGYEKKKENVDDDNKYQTASISNIRSLNGDTKIIAQNGKVESKAALIDGVNVDIYGKSGVDIGSIDLGTVQNYNYQLNKKGFGTNINFKAIGNLLKDAAKTSSPTATTYSIAKAKVDAYQNNNDGGTMGAINGIHAANTASVNALTPKGNSPIGVYLTNEKSKTANNTQLTESIGSDIKAANRLNIQSGSDINIIGSDLFAGNQINAYGKNINILSNKEQLNSQIQNFYRQEGLPDNGTLGSYFFGMSKTIENIDNTNHSNRASNIKSGGNINFYAENNYTQIGSLLNARNNIDISAKDIGILSATDNINQQYKNKFIQKGLTVGVSSPLTDAIANTQQNAARTGKSKNPRINAMSAANTAYSAYQSAQAMQNIAQTGDIGLKVKVTYGEQHNRQTQENSQTFVAPSSINGENVRLIARENNINIIGSDVSGRLLTDLTAAKDVNIKAAKEIGKEHNNFENIHAAVGAAISFNGNGASIGVTAEGEYGKGKANGDNINYRNSYVGSSTGQTNISAGKELNINGGQVLGKGVKIDAQKLNIETVQNAMNYNSNQFNASVDFTIGYGASAGGNVSASKIKANYQSINEQSGIFAGDDGYQINIKDNTHLNGGLITSTANAEQNGKNRFETGTITFKDLANKAEYKGEAFGIGISGSVKGNNPNSNSSIYTVDKTGMSNTMGYGRDKESQSSITYAGINTANITIRDTAKQQALTGKTAEEIIKAVKTNITLENHQNLSGRLDNNFDAKKVQSEIDLQVEVTKEFSNNVRDFQSKQNKRLDELKEKKDKGEISQKEYQEQAPKIERQKLITNVVAGGLLSPADSLTGIAVSAVSPAVSHKIGQHFKKEGKEGSFEHIATHAVIGALTSAANGGNALSGAISAGGAEYIAQVTANTLFNKKAEDLTADEKQTVSTISQLVGVVSGSVTGDSSVNAYIGNLNAENAVNNNFLTPEDRTRYNELTQKIIKGTATDKETQEWIKKAKFDQMTEELLRRHWRGEELSTAERQTLRQALREVYGKDASGVYKGEIDNYLGVANFYPFGMPDEYKIYHNKQVKESNKMRPLRNDESLLEYGLAYLQNNREMNDYEKAYNKLLKEKSLKEDSLEFKVAQAAAPGYIALVGGYTPYGAMATASVAQGAATTVFLYGEPYTVYDAAYDATLGVVTGKIFDKATGKMISWSKQVPVTDRGRIIQQLPPTRADRAVQKGFEQTLRVTKWGTNELYDTALSEGIAKGVGIDTDKSRVIFSVPEWRKNLSK